MATILDSFGARGTLKTASGEVTLFRLNKLAEQGIGHVEKLPFSIKILLENALLRAVKIGEEVEQFAHFRQRPAEPYIFKFGVDRRGGKQTLFNLRQALEKEG